MSVSPPAIALSVFATTLMVSWGATSLLAASGDPVEARAPLVWPQLAILISFAIFVLAAVRYEIARIPMARLIWDETRNSYTDEYVALVDDVISSYSSDRLSP